MCQLRSGKGANCIATMTYYAWYKASAVKQIISEPFWDVKQRVVVITNVSGQPIDSLLKSEDQTDRLSRNVVKEVPPCAV